MFLIAFILYSINLVILANQVYSDTFSVFGVRWFLGNQFAYKTSDKVDSSIYICAFNSIQNIDFPIQLHISSKIYSCAERHIKLPYNNHSLQTIQGQVFTYGTFETYIYFCHVDQNISSISNYSIRIFTTQYQNVSGETKMIKYQEITLFEGTFRPIPHKGSYKLLSIGDWGQINSQIIKQKHYIPIRQCTLKQVQDDLEISGVLFLGDLGYDMQGQLYNDMLKYLQPLTKQMVWISVPGNHDTTYHDDNFVLFTQSFFTPQWKKYFNFFFTAQISKDLLIIGLNPEKQFFNRTRISQKINLQNIFSQYFDEKTLNNIKQNQNVILINHYPIYCSQKIENDKGTCHPKNLTYYRRYFNQFGMNLYLSGHLHVYQRTQPICYLGQQRENIKNQILFGEQYISQCPTYIIQGTAGNTYFVQTIQQYQHKPFNAKLVLNTGFGILKIKKDNKNQIKQLQYNHISSLNCSVSDQVKIPMKKYLQNNKIFVYKSTALIILILAGCLIFIWRKCFVKKEDSNQKKRNQNGSSIYHEIQHSINKIEHHEMHEEQIHN